VRRTDATAAPLTPPRDGALDRSDADRASKRLAKVSIGKLPSALKLLQLAIALHKVVDTEEDGRIFPSVDEIEADADIRSWRIILSDLEIEPYFQSIGAHVRRGRARR